MKKPKNKNIVAAILVASSVTSFAGSSVVAPVSHKEVSSETDYDYSVKAGFDFSSGTQFRGKLLDSNLSYQPSLNLSVPFKTSFLDSSNVFFNTTQFFQQKSPTSLWFRSELELGLSFTKSIFTISPSYQLFHSPNGKFGTSQGFNLRTSIDDRDYLGLNPYMSLFFGTKGASSNGGSSGNYYEVGISPSHKIWKTTVSLPVSFGFGFNNYYANNRKYGFSSLGVNTLTPIIDNLNFKTSVQYYNTTDKLNNGHSNYMIGRVGVEYTF